MARAVYQKIQYLQNTVLGEVIDLEVPLVDTLGFDIKMNGLSRYNNDIIGFGAKIAETDVGIYFRNYYYSQGGNYKQYIRFGNTNIANTTSYATMPSSQQAKITNNANATSITVEAFSKTLTRTKTEIGTFNYPDLSLYLFGLHTKTETEEYLETKHTGYVFYAKITNNGVLIRDMIPVKRLSDGIYGLFDKVSKKFFIAKSGNTTCFTGTTQEVYYDSQGNELAAKTDLIIELNQINETKNLIKQAIINKGQTVEDTDSFRSYVDKIAAIETGNGGVLSEKEYDNCLSLSREILLPPEPKYELLSYVRNPFASYIDTGINPYGKKLKCEFKFGPITGLTGHTKGLFGGFNATEGYNLFTFYHDNSAWNFYAKSGAPLIRNITKGYSIGYTGDILEGYIEVGDADYSYNFIINNPSNNMNNVVYEGSGNVSGRFPTSPTITIFCQNSVNGPVTGDPAITNLYYFRMYLDDVIVRDFIPVKDTSGVVCLYDKATRTFFYSQNGNLEGGV